MKNVQFNPVLFLIFFSFLFSCSQKKDDNIIPNASTCKITKFNRLDGSNTYEYDANNNIKKLSILDSKGVIYVGYTFEYNADKLKKLNIFNGNANGNPVFYFQFTLDAKGYPTSYVSYGLQNGSYQVIVMLLMNLMHREDSLSSLTQMDLILDMNIIHKII